MQLITGKLDDTPDCTSKKMHIPTLLRCALNLYREGRFVESWKMLNRYCALKKVVEPEEHLLKADILARLSKNDLAIRSLELALQIHPGELAAHRRLLAWSESKARKNNSAHFLLAFSEEKNDFRQAGQYLIEEGNVDCCGEIRETSEGIFLKTIWHKHIKLIIELVFKEEAKKYMIEVELGADNISTVSARIQYQNKKIAHASHMKLVSAKVSAESYGSEGVESQRPQLSFYVHNSLGKNSRISSSVTHSINKPTSRMSVICRPLLLAIVHPIFIVIPIYKDLETLTQCLTTVIISRASQNFKIILIDDCSPDLNVKNFIATMKRKFDIIHVITNSSNLGFVKTVNKALTYINKRSPESDVILLNSDTVVPPGFVDRLMKVAYTNDDIGTVTPLTNNGEYNSFPIPFVSNSIGNYEDIVALDSICSGINLPPIDIPSGIGFCLYVKRDCLDAVGLLDETIIGGYLEDLDYSMRARMFGLRNVCATAVYVGHVGSKSFSTRKRGLVVDNLTKMLKKHPEHSRESAAFVMTDPLRSARRAIEQSAIFDRRFSILILYSETSINSVVKSRIFHHRSKGSKVLTFETDSDGMVRLKDPDGGIPQTLAYNLNDQEQRNFLRSMLTRVCPGKVEVIDLTEDKYQLLFVLSSIGIGIDIFVTKDFKMSSGNYSNISTDLEQCVKTGSKKLWITYEGLAAREPATTKNYLNRTDVLGIDQIIPINERAAQAIGKHDLKVEPFPNYRKTISCASNMALIKKPMNIIRLALVDLRSDFNELNDIAALVSLCARARLPYSINVIGKTYDDLFLMRRGEVYVSGKTCISEINDIFDVLKINMVFSVARNRNFFEEYDLVSDHVLLPMARFSYPDEKIVQEVATLGRDSPNRQLHKGFTAIRSSLPVSDKIFHNKYDVAGYSADCSLSLVIPSHISSICAATRIVRWSNKILYYKT